MIPFLDITKSKCILPWCEVSPDTNMYSRYQYGSYDRDDNGIAETTETND